MRDKKGNSLIQFPENYIVIDIETTGLSPEYDSIIEICALKFINGELSKFSTLINPGFEISDFISALTGITNDMLSTAPSLETVIPSFFDFVNGFILVGHNIHFDLNFLYDACSQHLSVPLTNDFIDTLRIARRLHPELKHHRLSDLSDKYNLDYTNAHRAEADCLLTNKIFCIFRDECLTKYGSLENAASQLLPHNYTYKYNYKVSDIVTNKTSFDISHPLYGKVVVFTGALEKMVRKDAMQLVVDYGGINGTSVTKSTNLLVLGNNDYCKSIKEGKSNKQKQAEKMKLDGYDIDIIPETVFYDMLDPVQDLMNLKPNNARASTDGLPMTTDVFNDFEISVFQYIKDIYVSAGRDVTFLRCTLSGSKFLCIQNYYEIIRLKLRGKKIYFLLHQDFDSGKYNLPPFTEASDGKRYEINSVEDLQGIRDLLLDLFDSVNDTFMKYVKDNESCAKSLRHYMKNNYR